ncbi:MAG: gamma-butyrobetaine hydroxylase-like domain-containing protein [Isosphaeraceae bacterium]
MELVGSYALKIGWSDGHGSGLFTWENLLKICESIQA